MVRPSLRLTGPAVPAGGAFLVALTLAAGAHANGRFPAAGQVVVSPSDASTLALRTTFGVVLSHDGGQTWAWTCEQAIASLGIQEDPTLGLTANALLAGTLEGLSASHDRGCSWAIHDATSVVDLVVRRGAPSEALVLRSFYAGDGGALTYATTVEGTTDDGAHWAPVGAAIDPSVTVQTLEIAPADRQRIYLSGSRSNASGITEGVVLVSMDGGAHYVTTVLPLTTDEGAPFLAAVDPNDPRRVYVRTNSRQPPSDARGDVPNRLLLFTVASDGSATFRPVLSTTSDMLGFALSDDGTKVYVGGPRDGLKVAKTADFVFAQTSTQDVECLTASGGAVYACSTEAAGFLLGKTVDDGAHFTALLHLGCLDTPLACGPEASAAICARPDPSTNVTPNDAFRAQNGSLDGGCPAPGETRAADAGADAASPVDAGASDDGSASGQPKNGDAAGGGGGGCVVPASGDRTMTGGLVVAGVGLAMWLRKRR